MTAGEFAWKGVDKLCCEADRLDMKVLAMGWFGLCLCDATDRDGLAKRAMGSKPRLSMKLRDGESDPRYLPPPYCHLSQFSLER
jgi:hypothetical protein